MQQQSLNGDWELTQVGQDERFAAIVPGCVHTDLLAAGAIDEPFYRDNELRLFWIGEAEVSNAEYLAFLEATGHPAPSVARQAGWPMEMMHVASVRSTRWTWRNTRSRSATIPSV